VTILTGVCLVLPTFTTSTPGPQFSTQQLAFAAVASLTLYVLFVLTQTGRHRDFFLPVDEAGAPLEDEHARPPSNRQTWTSAALLLVSLVGVVGLAKIESKSLESLVAAVGLPQAVVGVVIAVVVLAPETLAAVRAARRGKMQISLNLAYGSAMASVGLTVPVLAVANALVGHALAPRPGARTHPAVRAHRDRRGAHGRTGPGHPPAGRPPPVPARRVPLPLGEPLRLASCRR
jgi:Ca2+:H+ antiporter